MKRQITQKKKWYEIETDHGTEFIDYDFIGDYGEMFKAEFIETLSQYIEGVDIYEWDIIEGYGARMSAPGYLDCTEWAVFDTKQKAENYLTEMYELD